MKTVLLWGVLALVLMAVGAALGGWLGYSVGYASGLATQAQAVQDARSERDVMRKQWQATRDGLAELKARLQKQMTAQAQLQRRAQAAAMRRKTRIATLTKRANALTEELRHDPDNQTLARVPVPDALARRLWPGAHAHDHTP